MEQTDSKSKVDSAFDNAEKVFEKLIQLEKDNNRRVMTAFFLGVLTTIIIARAMPRVVMHI